MKISKKRAIKFAVYERKLRDNDYFEDGWTVEEDVVQEKDYEAYMTTDDASHSIATMMFDRQFDSKEAVKQAIKVYGKKLWEKAKDDYVLGNHDT